MFQALHRILLLILLAASPAAESSTAAKIVVHPSVAKGEISPYLYSAGLEWLDNGDGLLDSNTNTLRPDILALLMPLHVPVWRFPGGILSDYYHWQDGVGPMASRPQGTNPMDGTVSSNNFGTDELIAFCRAQNSEPLITANFGTGTLSEALAWQQYFLDKGMPVRLWEIGNEEYLAEPTMPGLVAGDDARIYHTPSQYASAFPVWARALRAVDPLALVGAIAGTTNTSPQNTGWLQTLLTTASQDIDFITLHNSFAPLIFSNYDYSNPNQLWNAYGAMYAQSANAGDDTRTVEQLFVAARPGAQGRIAITEHFPLFGSGATQDQILAILDQSRTAGSALFTASLFHNYIRQNTWMANYNLGTSPWFGALVTNTPSGLVKTPTYYIYDLYRNHFGSALIGSDVTSPKFNSVAVGAIAARTGMTYLDVIASKDASGKTYVAVINRNPNMSIPAAISVDGLSGMKRAAVYTVQSTYINAINGPSLTATTTAGNISTRSSTWTLSQNATYTFPPNSVTVLSW